MSANCGGFFDVPKLEGQLSALEERLSAPDFWTSAGIRTMPRTAPAYNPGREPAHGLQGGVWIGASFWYAFAAATFAPDSNCRQLIL